MCKKTICALPMFLVFLLLFAASPMADTFYVNSKQAKLRSNPKQPSAKDMKLERETPVESIKQVQSWFQVKTQKNQRGWIEKSKLTKNVPTKDPSLLAGGYNPLAAEDVAAGSAVRGLSPLALKFGGKNQISEMHRIFADYHQSYITTEKLDFQPKLTERGIELVKITEQHLESFLSEGKLGEFGNAPDVQD